MGSPQPRARPRLQPLSQAFQNLAGVSFCSTPPSMAGCLPNCVFIYFCIFPAPRTHWCRVGGGEAKAGSQCRPKKKESQKIGSAAPHIPQRVGGSREAQGWLGKGWERGAGRGDAGGITHPLCFVHAWGN